MTFDMSCLFKRLRNQWKITKYFDKPPVIRDTKHLRHRHEALQKPIKQKSKKQINLLNCGIAWWCATIREAALGQQI